MQLKINNINSKRLLVILRSAGESTANKVEELIRKQLTNEDLLIKVSEKPFFKTLKQSYQYSIFYDYKWTLMIDGDVLPKTDAIKHIVNIIEHTKFGCLQGYVIDYLYGGPRIGGMHIYFTQSIKEIINKIPNIESIERPETYCKNLISKCSYQIKSIPIIVGIHDYFQYLEDYNRKIILFHRKNNSLMDYFNNYWRSNYFDFDFQSCAKNASMFSKNKNIDISNVI